MRVFIGIDFPISIKERLFERAQQIRSTAISGNFSRMDLYHLTLNFIGDITPNILDELCPLMDAVARNHTTFEIKFGGIGAFNRKDKQIIFNELAGDLTPLKALQRDLEARLVEGEYPVDAKRRYKPHVTLGREVKTSQVSLLEPLVPITESVTVDRIILFESSRIHGKLHYIPIHTSELKK